MPWSTSGLSNRTGLTATASSAIISVPNRGWAWSGGDWRTAYTLPDTTQPSVIMDFVGNQYSDGTNTPSSMGALLTGTPTRDAAGFIPPGNNSIQAKGALLTAFAGAGTGATVAAVIDRGNQLTVQVPISMGANNNLFMYLDGGLQKAACYTLVGGTLNFLPSDFTGPNFFASGYATTTPKRTATFNDQTGQQDDNAYDAVSPVVFGGANDGSNPFLGRIRNVVVYPKRLTGAQLSQIRALAPFSVAKRSALYIPDAGRVTLAGTNLRIERTQPWSFLCNFAIPIVDAANGHVLFTNVISTPWCGYEVWLQGTVSGGPAGRVCVRIMQDLTGSSGPVSAIDLNGSIAIEDGAAHMVGVTYDGSSTAAGVKVYVDGVLDNTITIRLNNLAGSIIGNAGQMWIGNQTPGTQYGENILSFMAFSNIVRSAGYMAAASSYANKPALDANTTLFFDFSEGSGTTLTDKSSSGFNGTITGSTWY